MMMPGLRAFLDVDGHMQNVQNIPTYASLPQRAHTERTCLPTPHSGLSARPTHTDDIAALCALQAQRPPETLHPLNTDDRCAVLSAVLCAAHGCTWRCRYVGSSAMVLVFLTVGYFESGSCLAELRAARRRHKPLIVMRETSAAHGAAPLSMLKASCPPDLSTYVFGSRESPAPVWIWHRDRQHLLRVACRILERTLAMRTAPRASTRRDSRLDSTRLGSTRCSAPDLTLPSSLHCTRLDLTFLPALHPT
jgi:hypothetical protein